MIFGELAVVEARGAILAHSLKFTSSAGKHSFKKGRVLSAADILLIQQAGIDTVVAARLEDVDVPEDEAAAELAAALCGDGIIVGSAFTGRCNLFAAQRGLLVIDTSAINRINTIDEALTVASLAPYAIVEPKQMLATVKVIPFSVERTALAQCTQAANATDPVIRVAAFHAKRVGLIQTRLAGTKESVLDKTSKVLQMRLDTLDSVIETELRCQHDESEIADAIAKLLQSHAELILIAGASAIVDRRDIVPTAITRAGGAITHFGMPVDPGNLLLLAKHNAVPVLGLPGCARSPKFNGFDQVLERLVANLPVTATDIMALGAGGLLKDFVARPSSRITPETTPTVTPTRAPRIHAIVLAAGQSRRMGQANKLLLTVDGMPMIAKTVNTLTTSQVDDVWVVTGHEHERIEQALSGYSVHFVYNAAFRDGLSASLRAGLATLPDDVDGVLVCLGDMPRLRTTHINRLLAAFDPLEGRAICVPTFQGKLGNPVLWSRRFFAEMADVVGDVGAKHLIGEHDEAICEVEMNDRGVLFDVDSPEVFAAMSAENVS